MDGTSVFRKEVKKNKYFLTKGEKTDIGYIWLLHTKKTLILKGIRAFSNFAF